MPYQKFLVAPFEIGQENDVEPWLLPEKAFSQMENVYLYRGRVKKKFGFTHLDRLRTVLTAQALGNTGASPFTVNILTTLGLTGQIIPGTVTINIAAPVGPLTFTEPATPDGTLQDATLTYTGTINYNTGALTLNHGAGAASAVTIDFTYAKCLPVMGCCQRQIPAINAEETICFDTESAYIYNTATGIFNDITPAGTPWTGSDAQFFSTTNYYVDAAGNNLLWVVNNNAADRIRYFAGTGTGWTVFVPQLNAGGTRFLWTSLLIVPYRNRLVCLNTTERDTAAGTTTNYKNRARWCKNASPLTVTHWDDTTVGKGCYIDAPTNEAIRTAQFVKDVLVVGFERSTWALKYSGNKVLPFYWERVNTEEGCESPWSSVIFDDAMLQVGYRGITASNSTGTQRIDLRIPDIVQEFHNQNDGQARVHGIRDFNNQMVYWTYPNSASNGTYPDKILAFNYYENAFSVFDSHFTALGYYEPFNDVTWASLTSTKWQDADFSWNSGQIQSGYPSIIAGNQVGFVAQLKEITTNDVSLYITGATQALPCVLTVPNHNLQTGQCIHISNVIGMTELNDNYYFVVRVNANSFSLQELDANGDRVNVDSTGYTAYESYGLITLIDNFSLLTKRFNFFTADDSKVRIKKINNLLDTTDAGEVTLNVYMDQNSTTPVGVYTVETEQSDYPPLTTDKEWIDVFINTVGNFLQLEFTMNDSQLITPDQNTADFTLHAIGIEAAPSGRTGSWA